MKVGAVDAVCSLLESDRKFQGGKHTTARINEIIEQNSEHKRHWLMHVQAEIQRIEQPNLQLILDLQNFPNVGINQDTYDVLCGRVSDTLKMLEEHGYKL